MAARDQVIAFCDELLDADAFDDYGPNGIQVPGASEVSKLATGVSANLETLRGAAKSGAQLVLTHHGLFWEFLPRALTPQMTERLRVLLDGDVSLAAYHLPLDAHSEVGNNALLCGVLGFEASERFGTRRGPRSGSSGGPGMGWASRSSERESRGSWDESR